MNRTGFFPILVTLAVVIVAVVSFIVNNSSTKEATIDGTGEVSGLRCVDKEKLGFIVESAHPISHTNTVTATFFDGGLSSITYAFEGIYDSESVADYARDSAESNYNRTIAEEYGLDITDFTRNMMVSENKLYVSVTANGDKNLNSKTAAVFMLSDMQAFPNKIEAMNTAYEDAGFECVKNN